MWRSSDDIAHRYPSAVATLSRRAKARQRLNVVCVVQTLTVVALRVSQDLIETAFEHSVDGGRSNPLLGSRLHDFGFRGCTSVEQVFARRVALPQSRSAF